MRRQDELSVRMEKRKDRGRGYYNLKGKQCPDEIFGKVLDGSRMAELKTSMEVRLNWSEVADMMSEQLLSCEILFVFNKILNNTEDPKLLEMLESEIHRRLVALRLMEQEPQETVA